MVSSGGQSKGYPQGMESAGRRRVTGQKLDLTGSRGDQEHLSYLRKLMNEKGSPSPRIFSRIFLSDSKEAGRCAAFTADRRVLESLSGKTCHAGTQ